MLKRQQYILQLFCIVLLSGCLVFVVSCAAPRSEENSGVATQATTLDTILEDSIIRVGTTGDWSPMTFLDPDTGEYKGYYVDVIKDLAADMGVEIEWVRTTWQEKVAGLATGKYDITTGASYNIGRFRQGAFTLPIAIVGTVPLTLKKNEARFTTWESINQDGVTVAVTLGTTQDQQAQSLFPNAELVRPDSGARDFQEVIAGRADVSITSNIEAQSLIQRFPNLMIISVEPQATLPNGMLVKRSETEWLHYVDAWIIMKEYAGYFDTKAEEWGLNF